MEEFGFGIAASLTFALDANFLCRGLTSFFSRWLEQRTFSTFECFQPSWKDDVQEPPFGRFFRLSLKHHTRRLFVS